MTRRRFLVGAIVMLLLIAMAAPASAAGHIQTSEIDRFDGKNLPGWAEATLVRDAGHVTMTVDTKVGGRLFELFVGSVGPKWSVGDATTAWFVIFNNPGECTLPGCGADDVEAFLDGGPNDAGIGLHYGTGSVTKSAKWSASLTLAEGDAGDLLVGETLADASATEVHLVIRSHGPAANLTAEELAAALTTVDGGCDVNTCGDAQDAVFLPIAP